MHCDRHTKDFCTCLPSPSEKAACHKVTKARTNVASFQVRGPTRSFSSMCIMIETSIPSCPCCLLLRRKQPVSRVQGADQWATDWGGSPQVEWANIVRIVNPTAPKGADGFTKDQELRSSILSPWFGEILLECITFGENNSPRLAPAAVPSGRAVAVPSGRSAGARHGVSKARTLHGIASFQVRGSRRFSSNALRPKRHIALAEQLPSLRDEQRLARGPERGLYI